MKNKIHVKIPKKDITLLTKIIEGYDNLGVVSTIDARAGLAVIHLTPDTEGDLRRVLRGLPFVESIED